MQEYTTVAFWGCFSVGSNMLRTILETQMIAATEA